MLGDDKFEIRPMGRGFVKIGGAETDPEDLKMAYECWQSGRDAIYSGNYDLVVLDEINYTISYKMLDPDEVAESLKNRPENVHVICTGAERASEDHRVGRPGDGDARDEASLHQRHSGPAWYRLLVKRCVTRCAVSRGYLRLVLT